MAEKAWTTLLGAHWLSADYQCQWCRGTGPVTEAEAPQRRAWEKGAAIQILKTYQWEGGRVCPNAGKGEFGSLATHYLVTSSTAKAAADDGRP